MSGSNQPLKLVDRAHGVGAPDAQDVQWEAYEVPELLAALREHAGLSLDQVAAALRIRVVYLRAIEDGRFDDLPGPTYAVGFVRAYADHLGLDPETTVRRFKAERDGITRRQELVFPVPTPDARVPGRSLIGLSVVLAMAAYGGWYYLSSQDRSVIELVEQVPASLQAMLSPITSPATETTSAQAEPPIPVIEPPAIQREAVNPVVAAMLGDEAAADTAATPAPPAPPVGGDVAVQAASLPSAAVAAGQDEGATPGPGAREYGATDGPARIVLEATEENWIQVRSRTNQAIFTQILHGGDRYYVPAEDGLSLTTGKAGALIVTVDGKRLNALGAVGAVRRGVPLDVGSLLQEPGPAAIAAED